jgi:hypothetical protein
MVGIHATLYMPVWCLKELLEARNVLKLTIPEEQLAESFRRFGGVPRVCFVDSESLEYEQHEALLDQGINKIKSFSHFVQMLENKEDPEQIPHRLFQFVPVVDKIYHYYLKSIFEPISAMVECAVSEHLKDADHAERIGMLLKLEGVAKASSFYGFLFEPHVHEVLMRDKRFHIRSLEDSSRHEFEINPDSQIEYIRKKSYAEYAAQYLQIPLASNHRSCDCWYVDTRRRYVVFFQITSSYHHPVSKKGLDDVIVNLSKSDENVVNYEKILLFVVPDTNMDTMSARYSKQTIDGREAASLSDSKKDILFKDVYNERKNRKILSGFGKKRYDEVVKVVGMNEETLSLKNVYSKLNELSTKSRNALHNFFHSIAEDSGGGDLKQYVLGIPVGTPEV